MTRLLCRQNYKIQVKKDTPDDEIVRCVAVVHLKRGVALFELTPFQAAAMPPCTNDVNVWPQCCYRGV